MLAKAYHVMSLAITESQSSKARIITKTVSETVVAQYIIRPESLNDDGGTGRATSRFDLFY